MSYDPLSIDAQLSAILTRMDAQDKVLEQVLQQCIKFQSAPRSEERGDAAIDRVRCSNFLVRGFCERCQRSKNIPKDTI